jgi:hypothetical protein
MTSYGTVESSDVSEKLAASTFGAEYYSTLKFKAQGFAETTVRMY